MICVSTRGHAPPVSLKEAVLAGMAPDGGLYVPAKLEPKPDSWWSAQRGKSFQDLSIAIATVLAGDEIDPATIGSIVRDALNFPVRVVQLDGGFGVVELFHGPTFAFKDFGARMLARLMKEVHDPASPITILVATSGDTGSAVAQAFFGAEGVRVVVLYPDGQVSPVQEAQFTTLGGNVTAVAVQGTFDDCQRLAKEAFADPALRSRVRLTSANSISLGRLLPQIFYHAYAALQYRVSTPLTVSVPSGNFGNLVAGVLARKLGAPINHFSAPTTVNDTVPRYFKSGRVEPRASVRTIANAMDVGNPSNLERLQWLFDGDLAEMKKIITTAAYTDDDARRGIAELYEKYGYVADPHSAIGYLGCGNSTNSLFLATAHPAKFRDVVEAVIGTSVALPEPLVATLARKKVVQHISPTLSELSKLL
jgi:threonine synthase